MTPNEPSLWKAISKNTEDISRLTRLTQEQIETQIRLGCTLENLIGRVSELIAEGSPRCTQHTDKLDTIECTLNLLTSGQHPIQRATEAEARNRMIAGAFATTVALASLAVSVLALIH